jgi:hypothetical protein
VLKDTACAAFEAKVMPHFDHDRLNTRMVRLGDTDRIIVGYMHLSPDANVSSFMRFVVSEAAGHSTIDHPIMRCMDHALHFDAIVADDERQALDKLADWFIANKELISHSRPSWHAY